MGFDQAPYRSVYLPAQPLGPYLQNLQPLPQEGLGDIPDEGFIPDDGLSSDDEDDDAEDNNLEVYGHVDLYKVKKRRKKGEGGVGLGVGEGAAGVGWGGGH